MSADDSRAQVVISSPSGRGLILGVTGFFAVAMTIVTIYYLLHPETTGPTVARPTADSLQDVVEAAIGGWIVATLLWSLLAREVSLRGDEVVVVRSTGRRFTIARSDIKSVQVFPMFNEFFAWMSFVRGAPIGRALFFTRQRDLFGGGGSDPRR
jgi:hypothetical protein